MSTINVFPAGRLCSLRGVLMMWLLPAYVLVGAVSATGAYWSYTHMVGTFMDDQMQLLADSQVTQPGTPDWPICWTLPVCVRWPRPATRRHSFGEGKNV